MKKADAILNKPSAVFVCAKTLFIIGVLYFLVALEAVFPRQLSLFGRIPKFTLVFVILFSLRQKGILSLVLSVILGLLLDLVSGRALLLDSVLYLYISFWCVWIGKRMYIERFWSRTLAVFVFSILGSLTETVLFLTIGMCSVPRVSALFFEGVVNVCSAIFVAPLAKASAKERGENLAKKG